MSRRSNPRARRALVPRVAPPHAHRLRRNERGRERVRGLSPGSVSVGPRVARAHGRGRAGLRRWRAHLGARKPPATRDASPRPAPSSTTTFPRHQRRAAAASKRAASGSSSSSAGRERPAESGASRALAGSGSASRAPCRARERVGEASPRLLPTPPRPCPRAPAASHRCARVSARPRAGYPELEARRGAEAVHEGAQGVRRGARRERDHVGWEGTPGDERRRRFSTRPPRGGGRRRATVGAARGGRARRQRLRRARPAPREASPDAATRRPRRGGRHRDARAATRAQVVSTASVLSRPPRRRRKSTTSFLLVAAIDTRHRAAGAPRPRPRALPAPHSPPRARGSRGPGGPGGATGAARDVVACARARARVHPASSPAGISVADADAHLRAVQASADGLARSRAAILGAANGGATETRVVVGSDDAPAPRRANRRVRDRPRRAAAAMTREPLDLLRGPGRVHRASARTSAAPPPPPAGAAGEKPGDPGALRDEAAVPTPPRTREADGPPL